MCFEVVEAMNTALQGMPVTGVTAITLKDTSESRYLLFVAIAQAPNAEWRLLERQQDTLVYCIIGAGHQMEILLSLDAIPGFDAEFGLPGSGRRRCNDASDGPLGTVAVRSWANKELGESLVQAFNGGFLGVDMTILLANQPVNGRFPWTMITSEPNRACYFATGDDSAFHSDFVLRSDLIIDPMELTPLR